MVLEYEGTDFHGWQKQKRRRTVQGVLESALEELTGKQVKVVGSGRTDAGVHARGQVAGFSLATRLSPEELKRALNAHLPRDVVVRSLKQAPRSFHPQYAATRKHYRYRLLVGKERSPLRRRFVQVVSYECDLARMRQAARYLVGRHDFRAFTSAANSQDNTVRQLLRLDVRRVKDELWMDFVADGFLYNMVRAMVGTLLGVGRGKLSPTEIRKILNSRDRSRAGPTAPAKGLCLMRVMYQG